MLSEKLKRLRRKFHPGWNDEWPEIVRKAGACKSLQLGSGLGTILPGIVNVDINASTKPDVICDLNAKIFPFRENTFDMIVAISVLEHLDDFFAAMGEIHRISKQGASIHILVPHFSSAAAFVDPTHRQFLSARSCDYFIPGTDIEKNYGFYLPYRFKLKKRIVELAGVWNYFLPLRWLAEERTAFWEEYLCFLVRGAGVYWELEVVR
jgi:SAM-dependent methyltransferase